MLKNVESPSMTKSYALRGEAAVFLTLCTVGTPTVAASRWSTSSPNLVGDLIQTIEERVEAESELHGIAVTPLALARGPRRYRADPLSNDLRKTNGFWSVHQS
jgi:hypothetical protein